MRRRLRAGVALVAGLVVSLTAPSVAAQSRQATEQYVPGLRQPVELLVDQWGVPHIYAQNTDDLFLAQGFNAARDRLFQIDLWRRRGLGELSAVFGSAYVEQDRATRMFLYRGDMDREWSSYGPGAKQAATRFTDGINAYVRWLAANPESMPPEFQQLEYAPALWRPEDVVRIRSHGISKNVFSEVLRSLLVCAGGIKAAGSLWQLEPAWTVALPKGLDPCAVPVDVLRTYDLATRGVVVQNGTLRQAPADPAGTEGSNAWAISPGRSTTGRPILASDPHRSLTAPSLRYLAHLSAPGLDVIGAGEPALPGISIGHNGTVAFGLTIFGTDQEDLYVYQLDPDDPGRYRYGDGWERFRTTTEQVPVAGGAPVEVELPFTRHGPVLKIDRQRNLAYALRTTWLEPGTSPYFGSLTYMGARDFTQFAAAMSTWGGPPENQVYADKSGNIGWVPGGLTPKRTGYDGLLPVPGDGRYEWDGFYDGARLPRSYNPRRGLVTSANEFDLPANHPVQVGYEWDPPYRKQRIDEVLASSPRSSVANSIRLQADKVSKPAQRIVRVLAGLTSTDPDTARALELLRSYDGAAEADSPAAALFESWFSRQLVPAFRRAVLPPAVADFIPVTDARLLVDALENPERWFGSGGKAARDDLLATTLAAAYREVAGRLGADPRVWKWGALQYTEFAGPVGANVGPFPRGGSAYTVDASTYDSATYRQSSGASFKMVLDVGQWDNSRAVNAPGQSGDPRSPHYRDLAERWRSGEYFPLLYSRAQVDRYAAIRITLRPGGPAR
ncbi:penicillin acylase family protein [Nonomuraea guangzhouensis]|uniref:Penicillin acylase family protein n=1 Tax=Nonomuraea guangzhouensis TaxID=1291555 RepID=A0ABW4G002_9ACTN|nr:penicillin acylase family protein [Nonomuraea guangzhouensis]